MPSNRWDPAPDTLASPDPIDLEALEQLRPLEGERILRVWRTGRGYLIMTNLRCLEVWRKYELFSAGAWEAGPSFFYYNLAPPRVEFHRFLRLSEERGRGSVVVHLAVHDPASVAREIMDARAAGQSEWLQRRSAAEAEYRRSHQRYTQGNRVLVHEGNREVVLARCIFCGNLLPILATRCPSCGAPQR